MCQFSNNLGHHRNLNFHFERFIVFSVDSAFAFEVNTTGTHRSHQQKLPCVEAAIDYDLNLVIPVFIDNKMNRASLRYGRYRKMKEIKGNVQVENMQEIEEVCRDRFINSSHQIYLEYESFDH